MEGSAGPLEIVKKYWIYVVLGIMTVNILILNFFLISSRSQSAQTSTNAGASSQNSCSQGCVDQMNQLLTSQKPNIVSPLVPTSAVTPTLALLATPTSTPTSTPTPTPTKTVKEFFVPLGTGKGNPSDWTVVDGIGAKVDSTDYGNIKSVTFEISAQVPTGNQQVWIRLYNATTFQAVSGSDVTLSGGTATLLISSPITLSSGSNLYQIQLKTQLQANTNINMARLRIKTN